MSAAATARLVVFSHYTLDEEIELTYKHIKDSDVDECIEGYLAQLDGLYIVEGDYDHRVVDKEALVFIGLSKKRCSADSVAEEKKMKVHAGLPKDMLISKVYSIVRVSDSEGEMSDEDETSDDEE